MSGDRSKYHETLRLIADKTSLPVLFTEDGKKVVIALEHKNDTSASRLRKAAKLAHSIDHCNTCKERVLKFFPLSIPDKEGRLIPLFLHPEMTPEPYGSLAQMNHEFCSQVDIVGIRILTGDFLLNYKEKEGRRREGQLFHHFYVCLSEKTQENVNVHLLQKAFHRYCPEFLPNMLETLLPRCSSSSPVEKIKMMKMSLECIRDAIPDITYGKNILPSVSWLLRIVERFESMEKIPCQLPLHQRWLLCAEIMLWTAIRPDGLEHQNAVSCVIQQAYNNVLPVMSSAKDRSALIKIMNYRLSPENYQRRTEAPSMGQVQNAIQALGDFTNTIMTLSEAAKIQGAVVIGTTPPSSLNAFASMIKEATDPIPSKKSPWGLAAKCGSQISGLRDLVKYAREHPEIKMYLDASGKMASVYVADTTLSPEKLCVPYLWAFHGDTSSKKVFAFEDKWTEIAVIIPQYETLTQQNAIFLLRGCHRIPVDSLNCCFPSFLNVAIRRICGPAFEKLNEKIRLPIPTTEPAIGRGTSVSSGDKLMYPIKILVDGKELLLTNL